MTDRIPRVPTVIVALLLILAAATLLACGGGGGTKEDIAAETWDCLAEAGDSEEFEISMRMMFPAAGSLDEAKKQYVYISTAASIEDLEAARDEACG